jgi:urease accessory protein
VNDWTIWQLADSALPSGGFAHSAGLEASFQAGEVTGEKTLDRFLADSLWQAGRAMLPFVTSAHRNPSRLEDLDASCDAFLTNAIANRASRVQGRAFVSACLRIWPSAAVESLDDRTRGLCGHHAPVFGAGLALLGVPRETAQRMAMFTTSRGILAAAVRLGIVGPYRAQRLHHETGSLVDEVLVRCASLTDDEVSQTAPLIDVLQMSHDRLYSRLFQS